jgi:RNA polymerase sigma-70 factor (ECF subfamily)
MCLRDAPYLMTTPVEETLIAQSREGDLDSFNALVEMYQNQVFAVALRMVRDAALAEDLAQDAFISAYRNLNQYRGGSFKSWLMRIVRNATLDSLRKTQRRPTDSLDENMVAFESQLVSDEPTPDDVAENAELGDHIKEVMADLHPDQKMALVLIDIEGYSYEDAATAMSVSIGTVKSRLSRARGRMREGLMADPELFPSRFRQGIEGV